MVNTKLHYRQLLCRMISSPASGMRMLIHNALMINLMPNHLSTTPQLHTHTHTHTHTHAHEHTRAHARTRTRTRRTLYILQRQYMGRDVVIWQCVWMCVWMQSRQEANLTYATCYKSFQLKIPTGNFTLNLVTRIEINRSRTSRVWNMGCVDLAVDLCLMHDTGPCRTEIAMADLCQVRMNDKWTNDSRL